VEGSLVEGLLVEGSLVEGLLVEGSPVEGSSGGDKTCRRVFVCGSFVFVERR